MYTEPVKTIYIEEYFNNFTKSKILKIIQNQWKLFVQTDSHAFLTSKYQINNSTFWKRTLTLQRIKNKLIFILLLP